MTGWAESGSTTMTCSRITIGFMEDLGYAVDYLQADIYQPEPEQEPEPEPEPEPQWELQIGGGYVQPADKTKLKKAVK